MDYEMLYVEIAGEDVIQTILKIKKGFLHVIVQALNEIAKNNEGNYSPRIYAYIINRDEIEEPSEYEIDDFNFEGRRVVVNRSNLQNLIKY